jgi:FMN phosphatase YigB (HAD superfamily)
MIRTMIFDLSEVLIAGLVGIEKSLSTRLRIRENLVLPAFGGDHLEDVLCGRITEDYYLTQITRRQGWDISVDELKDVIRANLERRVPGMDAVLGRLSVRRDLVLLSDHAIEWVEYVRSVHPFLRVFRAQFYSCELGQTKREPSTFRRALREIDREPHECLFIDDYHKNIAVATSEGIRSILFESAEQLSRELTKLGLWK